MLDTKGYKSVLALFLISMMCSVRGTYNLKLYRHKSEVDHLHGWPDDIVCLERRHVDVAKFSRNSFPPSTLGDCHECEEQAESCRDG